jgi:enamine deaminase RidA (YjgF/YER057c/UK114 family)
MANSERRNRRSFLRGGALGAAAAAAAAPAANAADAPVKKVHWRDGKPPEKQALFSGAVSYGNLLFIAGKGAHFEGDIKSHTEHVLKTIEDELTRAGSSMNK